MWRRTGRREGGRVQGLERGLEGRRVGGRESGVGTKGKGSFKPICLLPHSSSQDVQEQADVRYHQVRRATYALPLFQVGAEAS